MQQSKTKKYTLIAVLAVMAYLLMFLAVSIIPLVPWMKLDLSDLPVLLGFIVLGYRGGWEILLLRTVIYFVLSGPSLPNLIGVGASLLASAIFCTTIYAGLKRGARHGKKYAGIVLLATLLLTIAMALANWLVITPLYLNVLGMQLNISLGQMILYGVIPFNLIKGIVIGIIFGVIYPKLSKAIQEKISA
ncbi:ECF transporter S component [Ligilactobacillus ceti]|uniref:Riboflavin transporter n=1 Tax=Ligilactobacillus ceti DSM 22408 TaxID=1122146 RepID=A0A0R2KI13_9LACO|nr:ECF transporter S component [Ligilactobacillus ceti]KRN88891.1 substrate-specific component ribu of riboflavin ecf transporter [Ligilactobacillus ceti DSM 22408]